MVVKVERQYDYAGEFKVKFVPPKGLKGVEAEEVTIPAGKNEAKLVIKAAADAKPGAVSNASLIVTALYDKKHTITHEVKVTFTAGEMIANAAAPQTTSTGSENKCASRLVFAAAVLTAAVAAQEQEGQGLPADPDRGPEADHAGRVRSGHRADLQEQVLRLPHRQRDRRQVRHEHVREGHEGRSETRRQGRGAGQVGGELPVQGVCSRRRSRSCRPRPRSRSRRRSCRSSSCGSTRGRRHRPRRGRRRRSSSTCRRRW